LAWRVLEKLEPRKKIGDTLLELGFITPADLKDALRQAKPGGPRVGTTLVRNGIITERQLAIALGNQFKMEFLDLEGIVPSPDALQCVPENVAKEQCVLPLSIDGQTLLLAVFDPLNVMNIQTVSRITKYELNVKICSEKQLRKAIEAAYSKGDMLAKIVKELTKEDKTKAPVKTAQNATNLVLVDPAATKDTASIESLVNRIMEQAVGDRASDIHIEPDEKMVRVRERVDGILREVSTFWINRHST
jgi:type IV pilus assembly protein PilB